MILHFDKFGYAKTHKNLMTAWKDPSFDAAWSQLFEVGDIFEIDGTDRKAIASLSFFAKDVQWDFTT